MNILIIGSGNLARHFSFYLSSLGYVPKQWARKTHSIEQLQDLLPGASHVLLAMSDRSIEDFISLHLSSFKGTIVHFSGAHTSTRAHAAHPLMTFGPELYALEFYKQIFFAVSPQTHLEKLIPPLKNPSFQVSEKNKALYHALCVSSGNLPQILWSLVLKEFNKLEIPSAALHLYIEKVTDNWIAHHDQALTGPLVRKDSITVNKNIDALQGQPLQNIYHQFAKELT